MSARVCGIANTATMPTDAHDAEPDEILHPHRRGRLHLGERLAALRADERLAVFDLRFLAAIREEATCVVLAFSKSGHGQRL